MALAISIVPTNAVTVPEDVASDLDEVATTLGGLPATRAAVVDFDTVEDARYFVRQARQWANEYGYNFLRKGDIKGEPTRVTFRLYRPTK